MGKLPGAVNDERLDQPFRYMHRRRDDESNKSKATPKWDFYRESFARSRSGCFTEALQTKILLDCDTPAHSLME